MQLERSTWKEVETYLARSRGVVIPLGSTEQHGPIGMIGTDARTATAVARGLGERAGALVGPTVALGVAQFNLGFPGTVSLRARTFMSLIEDYVLSLAHQGFERFYFVNGHGGNDAPAHAAFQDIYSLWSIGARTGSAPRCRLRNWWDYPEANRLRRELYGSAEGMHATPSEIAITLHLDPAPARSSTDPAPPALTDAFLRDHGGDKHRDANTHRAAFPDGRVGSDSSLARVEHGAALLEAAIAGALTDYTAFLAEP